MGVILTPIVQPRQITLGDLTGKTLAVDAHGELYQFLALIRLRDGTPLKDSQGRVTSRSLFPLRIVGHVPARGKEVWRGHCFV